MAKKSFSIALPLEFRVEGPDNATAAELMRTLAGALKSVSDTLNLACDGLDRKCPDCKQPLVACECEEA